MAADLKEAIENFRGQANVFRSLFELCDLLTPLADAQRAQKEAESARDQAKAELASLTDKTAAEEAKAGTICDDAEKHAAALISDAKAAATEQAKAILDKAQDDASALTSQASAAAKKQTDRAAKATADADAAEARVAAARQELSDLETKINATKAQIASMLQG